MTTQLKIALAQLNLHVGDIEGNLQQHKEAIKAARDEHHADLIIFPELSITGYPPEDLLLRPSFIDDALNAVELLIRETKGIYVLVGHPVADNDGCFNACSLFYNGELVARYAKECLPNYGVFDEDRYFIANDQPCVVDIKGVPVGILICHDIWHKNPIQKAAALGAKLIICANASPFSIGKHEERVALLSDQAKDNHVAIAYTNLVGGQDELIFDGGSMVFDADGNITHFADFFTENLLIATVGDTKPAKLTLPSELKRIYDGLVLSVRDYVNKNKIPGVLLGLSGGIDSALTLAIAVDAIGCERVHAVSMPSEFTANMSVEDAEIIARNFNVKLDTISIEKPYHTFLQTLAPKYINDTMNVTHENIQARTRAIILMALSNQSGNIVLSTGNRSELAVGYCTLYGDMAGGFAPLKDIPKTLVYELSNYRNTLSDVIPKRIIERAPSAELSPNQKDQDTLPPYPTLDKILEAYLNESKSVDEIINEGFDKALVMKIIGMVRRNEYKRRQGAIGPRINSKAFGRDWRYPITNGYKN